LKFLKDRFIWFCEVQKAINSIFC